jgi:hypothetical protein
VICFSLIARKAYRDWGEELGVVRILDATYQINPPDYPDPNCRTCYVACHGNPKWSDIDWMGLKALLNSLEEREASESDDLEDEHDEDESSDHREECLYHAIYGFYGRPTNIDYSYVFLSTLEDLLERWEDRGSKDFRLEECCGEHIRNGITQITRAGEQARNAILLLLDYWIIHDATRRKNDEDEFIKDEDFQTESIMLLPRGRDYLFKFIKNRDDKTYRAALVSGLFARGELLSYPMLDIARQLDREATSLGLEAYVEASAIFMRFKTELRPPDLAKGIMSYYIARRTDDSDMVAQAKAEMRYGKNLHGQGPLYRKAWLQYDRLPYVDREIAADYYCDGFIESLDRLPVEALLSPRLAISWALQAAVWAGNKAIPEQSFIQLHPTAGAITGGLTYDSSKESVSKDVIMYEPLPHYNLALRYYGYNATLSELGTEQGISKQAVQKRIHTFLVRARNH